MAKFRVPPECESSSLAGPSDEDVSWWRMRGSASWVYTAWLTGGCSHSLLLFFLFPIVPPLQEVYLPFVSFLSLFLFSFFFCFPSSRFNLVSQDTRRGSPTASTLRLQRARIIKRRPREKKWRGFKGVRIRVRSGK